MLPNCNCSISILMHINSIASIRRVVFGSARHEDVLACRGPCLDLIIDLSCQHGTTRCTDCAEKSRLDTARDTRGRTGTTRPKSQLYSRLARYRAQQAWPPLLARRRYSLDLVLVRSSPPCFSRWMDLGARSELR
jgi:hypothetical protein